MPQVFLIPFDGQEIGQGYNSETRESLGTGLTVANVSEDPSVDGQLVTTVFESVTSQEGLTKSLGISAGADVRYGLFSGGAKFDFAENHAVNSFSSFIAGRCVVHNAIRHGHGLRLGADAIPLVTAQRMDEFKTAFGDMFVRSLKTGGEFDVVVRITSLSEEHQNAMSASLHAEYNGLAVSGAFQASFKQAMTETHNQSEVTVFMSQAGGIGGQASFTGSDAAQIIARLREFPASVHEHPVGYEAEVAHYNTIPIPVPTAEEREDREIVLRDCFAQKMRLLKALADLTFVLGENAELFFEGLPPKEELLNMQAQYQKTLNALMSHAIAIAAGRMNPPQVFVASPPPPPFGFKKKPFTPEAKNPLALRGNQLANEDPLAQALRALLPDGARQQAFDMGMAAAEDQTLPGPGKQAMHDALSAEDRPAFAQAVQFSLDRNKANRTPIDGNPDHLADCAKRGAAVAKVDPFIAKARSPEPGAAGIFYTLGFDIATGLFGELSSGALGHTSEGPGSNALRDSLLNSDAQRGYRAAVEVHLAQKHRKG